MVSSHSIFKGSMLKQMVPVFLLSIVMFIGCSKTHDESHLEGEDKEVEVNEVFEDIETAFDARLGVYAWDTGTNETVMYRSEERFAYASTHKALAAGALLQQNSIKDLDERITYTADDLVNYNPITEKKENLDQGMTLRELCDASLRHSDNTAENLILEQLGGPSGLKKALRGIGDEVTNPERFEPELNEFKPGETHDTSTPKALATSLETYTLGDTLSEEKRALLIDWLTGNATGDPLIRAGAPDDWVVADKSGAGSYGTRNDIAIIWPPKGDPIVLAILSSRDQEDADTDDKLIEEAAKEVIEQLNVGQ